MCLCYMEEEQKLLECIYIILTEKCCFQKCSHGLRHGSRVRNTQIKVLKKRHLQKSKGSQNLRAHPWKEERKSCPQERIVNISRNLQDRKVRMEDFRVTPSQVSTKEPCRWSVSSSSNISHISSSPCSSTALVRNLFLYQLRIIVRIQPRTQDRKKWNEVSLSIHGYFYSSVPTTLEDC